MSIVKVCRNLGFDEGFLPGLQVPTFLLGPHMVLLVHECRGVGGREKELASLLIRTLIFWRQGPTLITSFHFNQFLTPNTATLGVRASTYNFRREVA